MRVSWIQILILFCCVVCILAAKKQSSLTPEEREARKADNWKIINKFARQKITELSSEEDFNKYIVRSPRNYTLVFLFNSDRECYACRDVDRYFVEYVQKYYENDNNTGVFFFRVPVERSYSMAMKLELVTAPAIMYVPPVKTVGFPHKRHQILYYQDTIDEGITTYTIQQFLSKNAGIEVTGIPPPIPWKYVYIASASAVVALPLLYLLIFRFKSPITWLYVCFLLYLMTMSGFVGNFVLDNPWYQYNIWTGEVLWTHTSLQRQFRLEGFYAGFLLILASLSFIGIVNWIPKFKSNMAQQLMFLLLLGLTILFLNSWFSLYCGKNPAYPYKYYFEPSLLYTWGETTFYDLAYNIGLLSKQ